MSTSRQAQIQEWFNRTYQTRGARYLRPVKAYYIFLELLDIQPNTKLLDVACGLGRLLEAGRSYPCEMAGVDISDVAIQHTQSALPEATTQVGNAEAIPFEADQFDYVTCLGSLERMLNPEKVLQEMQRVAKPGATFCLLVRNANTFQWKFLKEGLNLRNDEGHQQAMTLPDWSALFAQAGFETLQILPDQYPLHRKMKRRSLWMKRINFRTIAPSHQPLEQANEFIFLLKARDENHPGTV